MTNTERLSAILSKAGSQFVSVTFTKKDGSTRQLTMNPRHFLEVKGTGSPCTNPNIFRVVDIKLNQWRSFDADRVVSVKVAGQITQFQEQTNG